MSHDYSGAGFEFPRGDARERSAPDLRGGSKVDETVGERDVPSSRNNRKRIACG
jgi:hypothetical protein